MAKNKKLGGLNKDTSVNGLDIASALQVLQLWRDDVNFKLNELKSFNAGLFYAAKDLDKRLKFYSDLSAKNQAVLASKLVGLEEKLKTRKSQLSLGKK